MTIARKYIKAVEKLGLQNISPVCRFMKAIYRQFRVSCIESKIHKKVDGSLYKKTIYRFEGKKDQSILEMVGEWDIVVVDGVNWYSGLERIIVGSMRGGNSDASMERNKLF